MNFSLANILRTIYNMVPWFLNDEEEVEKVKKGDIAQRAGSVLIKNRAII